jgi:hypothetical protein
VGSQRHRQLVQPLHPALCGADYWPHHRINQRVTFDLPGSADSVNVNQTVLRGKRLRTKA